MSRFQYCFKVVNSPEVEGGLSNHPADSGKLTNYGVTQATYNEYLAQQGEHPQSVEFISQQEVEDIYQQYWDNAHCDSITQPLDLLVFDVAINSGPMKAIVLLQRALGMKPQLHTGNFGPITRGTLAKHGDIDELCSQYLRERVKFYHNRCMLDKTQCVFLEGWLNRVDHMATKAGIYWKDNG